MMTEKTLRFEVYFNSTDDLNQWVESHKDLAPDWDKVALRAWVNCDAHTHELLSNEQLLG